MEIYAHQKIQALRSLYQGIRTSYPKSISVKERLSLFAEILWTTYQEGNEVILSEINNYHPKYISKSWEDIKRIGFEKEDAHDTIAYEYGFSNWASISDEPLNIPFERAVDAILDGDQAILNKLLIEDPSLVNAHSSYGHQATLLHYLGNNGVELYRQVIPINISNLLTYLIQAGADPLATMKVYGGDFKMIDLFLTSAHPKKMNIVASFQKTYEALTM